MKKTKSKFSLEKLVALPFLAMAEPSPDGQRIAFVSNMSGQSELHVVDLNTREIEQLTDGEFGDTFLFKYNWTSDGASLVFPRDPTLGKQKFDLYKITYPDGKVTQLTDSSEILDAEGKPGPVGDVIAFFSDRSGSMQIHLMDGDGSNVRQITKEKGNVIPVLSDIHWSPDGEFFVYTKWAAENPQWYDIWTVRVDGTEERKIISMEGGSQEIANHLSKDGSMILFTSDTSGTEQVGVYYLESKEIRWISTTDFPEEGVRFTDNGKQVVVIRHVDAEQKLVVYDIATREDTPLKLPPGFSGAKETALTGRHLIISHQDSTHRMRYLLYDLDNHTFEEILSAQYGDFDPEDFHPDDYISYPSTEGVTIHAILYKPKDAQPGKKLPTLVIPHGGPAIHYVRSFKESVQVLVDRGYVCLLPNVRGSTGYGKEFRDACLMDWGGKDLDDIEKGVEYLKSLDFVDPTRIGIYGASYGGYLTYMAMTKKPELWKAGAAVNGITHLKGMHEQSLKNYPLLTVYLEGQMGKPTDENLPLWEDRSPVNFAHKMVAKLQIIHAVNDPLCGIKQAEVFRDKLLEHGRKEGEDFEYVILKDQGHFTDSIEQRIEYFEHLLDFFERNLE
ncbi:MAG: S9 family peptidase [Candidatus Thorarchaeota archaeon]|jgi:dipeptidyl aminopeptidase/acylaminoacyl peptidase